MGIGYHKTGGKSILLRIQLWQEHFPLFYLLEISNANYYDALVHLIDRTVTIDTSTIIPAMINGIVA